MSLEEWRFGKDPPRPWKLYQHKWQSHADPATSEYAYDVVYSNTMTTI